MAEAPESGHWITVGEGEDAHHVFVPGAGRGEPVSKVAPHEISTSAAGTERHARSQRNTPPTLREKEIAAKFEDVSPVSLRAIHPGDQIVWDPEGKRGPRHRGEDAADVPLTSSDRHYHVGADQRAQLLKSALAHAVHAYGADDRRNVAGTVKAVDEAWTFRDPEVARRQMAQATERKALAPMRDALMASIPQGGEPMMAKHRAAELDQDERDDLDDSDFAVPSTRQLPIQDAAHVRAAMSRFNQTHFPSADAKATAKRKILAAAKRLGIDVGDFADVAAAEPKADDGDDAEGHCHEHMHQHADGTEHSHDHYHDDGDHLGDHDWAGHTHLIAASQPSLSQVHVPSALGNVSVADLPGRKRKQADEGDDDDDDEDDGDDDQDDAPRAKRKKVDSDAGDDGDEGRQEKATERPTRAFLTRLRELLSPKVAAADLDAAIRGARSHAGGKGKAAARLAQMAGGEVADLCCLTGPARLFTDAPTLASAPDWIPYLPKPGSYQHPQWGKIAITKARNQRFVENFRRQVYQDRLPLDAEHETKLSGALGWIAEMRMNEDGSVDARVEWTDRGRTLLGERRFRYVSPEWYDLWTAPDTGERHSDVAIGGALTTRPFFKGESLRPLVASERGLSAADEWDDADPVTIVFVELAPASGPGGKDADMPNEQSQTQPAQLTEEQARRFAELEAKLAAEESARKAHEDALKQATEQIAAMRADARRKRFTDEVTGRGDASGLRWYGETDQHVGLLEKLADTFGEDSAELRGYVSQNRAVAEAMRQTVLFTEVGSDTAGDAGSPEAQLDALAKAHQEKHSGVTYHQAYAEVIKQHPELQRRLMEPTLRAMRGA